jgi:CheY-like chemotaxis protein
VPGEKAKLLIVDDHMSTLRSLSAILSESGYRVRTAEDGFSALVEIRNEIPDILLSDLNMPGMSGFELLSVVRRRFPMIRVIAMSGAFSGDDVPPGVAADAFYEKGTHVSSLLQIVGTMALLKKRFSPQRPSTLTPVWIPKNGHGPSGEEYVMVVCAECLRAFPQVLSNSACLIQQTCCAFCHSPIDYAIVQPMDSVPSQAFPRTSHVPD